MLFVLVGLLACGKSESPKYNDIAGHWYGKSATFELDFNITKTSTGGFELSSGTFAISGTKYTVNAAQILGANSTIDLSNKINEQYNTWMYFINAKDVNTALMQLSVICFISSDYSKMSCSYQKYWSGGFNTANPFTEFSETITITRK